MSPLLRSALVFVGAGFGGNARYWLGVWVAARAGSSFPWATFVINVSGSLAIGFVAGILLSPSASPRWWPFLIVGVLGGYTTFSSFSLETLNLASERSFHLALANILGSCLFGLAAVWLGRTLANTVIPRF